MHSLHNLAALAALVSFATSTPVTSSSGSSGWGPPGGPPGGLSSYYSPSPTSPPYLNDLAQSHGKLWFGSATDQPGSGEDNNTEYQTILNDTNIFGQLTPANYMKVNAASPLVVRTIVLTNDLVRVYRA